MRLLGKNHGAVPALKFPRYATYIPSFQTSCTVGFVHNNQIISPLRIAILFLFYVVLTEPINEHLRNKFQFSEGHGSMNAMGHMQSK